MTTLMTDRVLVDADDLHAFVRRGAVRAGLGDEHASWMADGLVAADLRGVHTHGVTRLPSVARGLLGAHLNPIPQIVSLRQHGATALLDGDNGVGLVTGQVAMRHAIELAHEHGVGVVSTRRSNFTGMLAFHSSVALRHDMIGYFVNNGPPIMPPWGGRVPKLCNNPFSWACPTGEEPPLVLDMACSAAARGKIRLAAELGQPIPEGWALDESGRPTRDSEAAMGGVVLPVAAHKGSGLAVINEVLAAVLAGAQLSASIETSFVKHGATTMESFGLGHLAIAINIGAFAEPVDFKAQVDALIRDLRASELAPGFDRVLLPGEVEWRLAEQRRRDGIPLPAATRAALDDLAAELGIEAIS